MLPVLASTAGLVVLAFVIFDVGRTTLSMQGGGPLTSAIGRATWAALGGLHRAGLPRTITGVAGAVAVMGTVAAWIAMSWLAWWLVFALHPGAIVDSTTGAPADAWSRLYFIGFAFITLGVGDFVPQGASFQIATVAAAIHGFLLVTLSISYAVPVLSAVVSMRSTASRILAIGSTPAAMLRTAWDGRRATALLQHVQDLPASLAQCAHQRHAYPVLRYFPSAQRSSEIAVAVPVLDEALTCLLYGVPDAGGVREPDIRPLRTAIDRYLANVGAHDTPREEPPPPHPSLQSLEDVGIPTVPRAEFVERVRALAERRRRLRALLRDNQRAWEDVANDDEATEDDVSQRSAAS